MHEGIQTSAGLRPGFNSFMLSRVRDVTLVTHGKYFRRRLVVFELRWWLSATAVLVIDRSWRVATVLKVAGLRASGEAGNDRGGTGWRGHNSLQGHTSKIDRVFCVLTALRMGSMCEWPRAHASDLSGKERGFGAWDK